MSKCIACMMVFVNKIIRKQMWLVEWTRKKNSARWLIVAKHGLLWYKNDCVSFALLLPWLVPWRHSVTAHANRVSAKIFFTRGSTRYSTATLRDMTSATTAPDISLSLSLFFSSFSFVLYRYQAILTFVWAYTASFVFLYIFFPFSSELFNAKHRRVRVRNSCCFL